MKHHTIVCGTSKSNEKDGYYIREDIKEKFWGSLYEAGITEDKINPYDYRELGKEYGIYITDIVDKAKKISPRDKDNEYEDYEEGLEELCKLLEDNRPQRILFNGKRAAGLFWQWIKFKKIPELKCSNLIGNYGLQQDWKYGDVEIYVLPNTSWRAKDHWDKSDWIEAWKACSQDFKNHQKKNL